ncbi:MAG: hypothetical protein K9N52_02255 [Verrucomicrobia bacterium]|nr:hypothetical protein [Verrucomicrobiota bacterium]
MKSIFRQFNLYLIVALMITAVGCKSVDKDDKKLVSTLRIHVETNPNDTGRTIPIQVYRDNPYIINVKRSSLLDEGFISQASVVDVIGGFEIRIQFNHQGTRRLEMLTTENKDKRLAIFSQFGKARWLAAPLIEERITNGVLTFTPDASREEAERIVKGLNNVAAELRKD